MEVRDYTTAIQILFFELPDAQEGLYLQPRPFVRYDFTYTCFSDLSTELLLEIWRLTFPTARIVRLFLQLKGERQ
jgi:hypothetical protein